MYMLIFASEVLHCKLFVLDKECFNTHMYALASDMHIWKHKCVCVLHVPLHAPT